MAQAVAPTIYGLESPRGHGFESDPLSFPDPTPHLFSPSHFLSTPSLSYPLLLTQIDRDKSKRDRGRAREKGIEREGGREREREKGIEREG